MIRYTNDGKVDRNDGWSGSAEFAEDLADELDALTVRARKLRDALQGIITKIDAIDAHGQLDTMFALAANRGMKYTGPDYEHEVIAARAALKDAP